MKKTIHIAFLAALLIPLLAHASGKITITYSNGSSETFLLKHSPSLIQNMSITTVNTSPSFALGNVWNVREQCGADVWTAIWTRRPGTEIFDAEWKSSTRAGAIDEIHFRGLSGGKVTLYREGNKGTYTGFLSANNRGISSGTATWYQPNCTWSATIH